MTATAWRLGVAVAMLFLMALIGGPAQASHTTFEIGDVFVGVANGQIQWYHPDGTLNQTLSNGVGGFTTGMAFDSAGHLYGTNFNAGIDAGTPANPSLPEGGGSGSVSEYDTDGTNLGLFGTGYSTPEDLLFDQSGDAYVGNLGGFTLKFDGDGNSLDSFSNGRTDWLDLAADQCTMFYTDESGVIHRYDVCAESPLPDFTATGGGFALRLLPTGGLIVADGNTVNRFDDAGNIIQTYGSGSDCWFALNLDPDGTSFWSADFCTADVVKFDIATGDVLESFNTGTGSNTVFGLTVFGEITVGGGTGADLSIDKSDSPDPVLVGNVLTYSLEVTNLGPEEAPTVVIIDGLTPGLELVSVSTSRGTCIETQVVFCTVFGLAPGDIVTVTIQVIPNEEGDVKNTGQVSSNSIEDPNLNNNSDTVTTTVNPVPGGGIETGKGGTASPGSTSPWMIALVVSMLVGAIAGVRRILRT